MILKDFKDIYNCKDIEYLRTIPRSRIKLFFETVMVENPVYIKKLKINETLEYLCKPLFDSIQGIHSVDFGKMIKILKEDKEKIYSKDLYWAILFMPTLCCECDLKKIYVYLRNIEVPKKRAKNILKFILFFDSVKNYGIIEVKEIIMIFGKKHILSLLEINEKLYTMKYPSKRFGPYYSNICLDCVKQILDENEICSFSKCPINKYIDLNVFYDKRLLNLRYILICEYYFGYTEDIPDDPDYFNNLYRDSVLSASMRDVLTIFNFCNLYYYRVRGRLNFD